MKRTVAIIGSFGFGKSLADGQTVKTKELARLLASEYGENEIIRVDTHGWKRAPWRLFCKVACACRSAQTVIMLPAHGALKVIPRLCSILATKDTKLYYDVIGGWLPEFLDNRSSLAKCLRKLDGIWVETRMMKQKLDTRGFKNVSVIPNFKHLTPLSETELMGVERIKSPRTFVMFSRVSAEKGVADAAEAIIRHNREADDRHKATLKIYGAVEKGFELQLEEIVARGRGAVEYCGKVEASKSVETLKDAYMLLFPTYYPGEGFPGTILDGFAAGLPVISSDWRYNGEVVTDGETGFLFPTHDIDALTRLIHDSLRHPEKIERMRAKCLRESRKYLPEVVGAQILSRVGIRLHNEQKPKS